MSSLENRLSALERTVTAQRVTLITAGIIMLCAIAGAAATVAPAKRDVEVNTLTAKELIVVNDKGERLCFIGQAGDVHGLSVLHPGDKDTGLSLQMKSDAAGIEIRHGKNRAALTAATDFASVRLSNPKGFVQATSSERSDIAIGDKDQKTRMFIYVGESGGNIGIMDEKGEPEWKAR